MPKDKFQKRITKLIAILAVGIVVLGIRLLDVQAVNSGDYLSRAQNELYQVSTLLALEAKLQI
jgi:Sec-independent protein translocase protein TatA